jgi:phage terminase large subunit-like protein
VKYAEGVKEEKQQEVLNGGSPMSEKEEIKKIEIEAAEIGMKCYNSLYFFFVTFWNEMSGDKYIDAPHIKYICDTIQEKAMKVIRGEFSMETLIINVPPGSSKSTIATIALPMWIWLHAPYLASTNVSYSASLSERHAKKARTIVSSRKWKLLFDNIFIIKHGKTLEIITENLKETENNFKGERFTASVDGNITGKHADFIIKDDMQDPKKAKSDTERIHCNEWDAETLSSRHKNPMCYLDIIIAQRLHEEDLTGFTLNKDIDITLICLPAEITNASKVIPKSAESIYTDGFLDPNRRPRIVLEKEKSKMGSAAYTCQYLQAPFNLEEQDITPSMFEIIESCKDDIIWDVWVDGAYTEKTENDPSGIDIIARVGNDIVVKQSYDVRKKLPGLLSFLVELEKVEMFDKDKSRIFIEPKASGHSLADYIENDTSYNFVRIGEHSKQEKQLVASGHKGRHETIKPKAESHRIKLLKGNWNDDFIIQICGYPRAAHDEHVDTLGYAINRYFHSESTFLEEWALNKLEKELVDSIPIEITSQEVLSRNGNSKSMAVEYRENDSGDVHLFDNPDTHYHYRYICVTVMRSESERNGTTCILVYDRLKNCVSAMYDEDIINPNKVAKRSLEIAYLYDKAKLVVCIKKETGQAQNEEFDHGHLIIQDIRRVGYDKLHSRLTVNNIKKKRERVYGFEVNRSTSREVYMNLKDKAETNKIKELPLGVFEDISVLERKKETGEIDGQDGKEVNRALAYSVALKVSEEWTDKPKIKNARGEKWN